MTTQDRLNAELERFARAILDIARAPHIICDEMREKAREEHKKRPTLGQWDDGADVIWEAKSAKHTWSHTIGVLLKVLDCVDDDEDERYTPIVMAALAALASNTSLKACSAGWIPDVLIRNDGAGVRVLAHRIRWGADGGEEDAGAAYHEGKVPIDFA